jgi:hypothetical protein
MKAGCFWTSILDCYADQDVLRTCLSVFEKDVEVPVIIKNSCVEKFVFEVVARTLGIRFYKIPIRVLPMRILVEIFHVIMSRCGV